MHYFVAQIKIHDHRTYQKYIDRAGDIFSKYNGEYLVVDDHPEIIEGKWNYDRTVIIRFNTKEDFKSWYHSKDYQEIVKDRLSSSICDTILLKGK